MRASLKLLAPILTLFGAMALSQPAEASSRSARKALKELSDPPDYNAVMNRFFVKSNRFELAPVLGYVPNNPMAKRYVGGLLMAYHFNEQIAAEGALLFAPDLGATDLKDLTHTLVAIANEGSGQVGFQQPVDKMILGATFAARWAPVYGKINLIGERVVNFDLYGTAGLGMLVVSEYYAKYDSSITEGPPTNLEFQGNKTVVPVNLGIGFDFFINSSVALKIDARNYIYGGLQPQYDPDELVDQTRLYNNFVASAGVSIFFPKARPRLYDF